MAQLVGSGQDLMVSEFQTRVRLSVDSRETASDPRSSFLCPSSTHVCALSKTNKHYLKKKKKKKKAWSTEGEPQNTNGSTPLATLYARSGLMERQTESWATRKMWCHLLILSLQKWMSTKSRHRVVPDYSASCPGPELSLSCLSFLATKDENWGVRGNKYTGKKQRSIWKKKWPQQRVMHISRSLSGPGRSKETELLQN